MLVDVPSCPERESLVRSAVGGEHLGKRSAEPCPRPREGVHEPIAVRPRAGGAFLGDYDGLTSSGTTFRALFAMSQPAATAGKSDLFSNSAG